VEAYCEEQVPAAGVPVAPAYAAPYPYAPTVSLALPSSDDGYGYYNNGYYGNRGYYNNGYYNNGYTNRGYNGVNNYRTYHNNQGFNNRGYNRVQRHGIWSAPVNGQHGLRSPAQQFPQRCRPSQQRRLSRR